ncbi:hypothetical protein PWT90_10823 [Aphanocladium album]|nr:hypothetical protein PWT90_10823 [Aphanocladium album]
MCTTTVFVHVRPDGRRSTTPQVLLCPSSRFGRPCAAHVEVHHPTPASMVSAPTPPVAAPVTNFPPTPTYSPRPSSRDSVASDDRHSRHSSRHSSTSSSQRRQRSPGIYVNGQRVTNVHGSSRRERIMLVPNPPTPRTPPQSYNMPRTAPPSPSNLLSTPYGSSPRDSYNRPYIVDERPRMHIQINPASPAGSSRHSRQTSTSSQGSHRSAAADEEDRRRRREEREERRAARKTQELLERIEKANAEIASRPAVRDVNEQQPLVERRSRRDGFDEVVGAMGRMTVEDKNWREHRAHEKALQLEREEQEAQNQRLRERMVPRRRATVGPGSRRTRVAYDDGLYRWE